MNLILYWKQISLSVFILLSIFTTYSCNYWKSKYSNLQTKYELDITNICPTVPQPPQINQKLLKYNPQIEFQNSQVKWQQIWENYLNNVQPITNN